MAVCINPLDIPHIIHSILDCLSVWNLKKCRLVCKYWYYEATPLLKKKSKISFKSEEEMEKCVLPNLDSLCQTFDIGVNINLYSSRTKSFFIRNKNTIKSLDLSFHHEYSSSWMIDVFSCLENIEELCLNGRATFLHEDTLAMCNLSVQLSKLKFLFIYDSSYDLDGSDARRIWKENIFQILQAAPNLERVFFAPFLESRAKTFFSLLTNEDLHHKGISHLHVNHFAASPLEIKILLNKNYPLKYVHLVLTCNLDRSDLNSFLHRLKLTLRELTLTFTDGTTCSQYHPIEPLDDVAKLSLIGYEGPFVISPAQKLQLFVMSLTEMPLNPWDIKISRGLKDLEIYDSKLKYFVENLRILYKSFTCLRSLKMNNINNDILRTIFTHLKSLNELHICFHKFYGITSVYIDSGMNGIPEYKLEDFLLDCMDARDIDHFRSFPWIGAMKNLKLLELELGHLSDFGIVLGITRCSSIRKLILKNCDVVFDESKGKMTDRSLEAICDLMDLHYLKIEGYVDCFSEAAINNARLVLEGRESYFL